MKKYKRVILVGKGGSGKDYLRKELESRGLSYAVSYTTRPPREEEIDHKDYIFISNDDVQDLIDSGFFYEHVSFNGWVYGTSVEQFQGRDLFIMTPSGISRIKPYDRTESFIIYIDIDKDIRYERLEKRKMPGDSVQRRIEADEKDFSNFTDFDFVINDPFFKVESLMDLLGEILTHFKIR
jgi:guanylate kinase